ncbi:hypothetical protein HOO65_010888 [Ceratocystis lukuohia]|uniref:Uncharacterized protein n=3 Tax=Ceratocystis TaxID=5157 RepID=A0A0F8DNG5_CERFI|nr:hypothetical protein CFO_g292 [Ceratocystis platani]PHH52796.1 hypothetical protein CFIMG_003815RA [Ceratocystis fimbriata CBS 114723]
MSSSIHISAQAATPQSVASSSSRQSSISSVSSSPTSPSPAQSDKRAMERNRRRPSLLSSAISQQETTHVDIGGPDSPRLISYLSSSQGFYWNPEIFLPSYIDCDYVPLELRRDAVHEIHITDEEAQMLLPQ